jgi:hypothetical protein
MVNPKFSNNLIERLKSYCECFNFEKCTKLLAIQRENLMDKFVDSSKSLIGKSRKK